MRDKSGEIAIEMSCATTVPEINFKMFFVKSERLFHAILLFNKLIFYPKLVFVSKLLFLSIEDNLESFVYFFEFPCGFI